MLGLEQGAQCVLYYSIITQHDLRDGGDAVRLLFPPLLLIQHLPTQARSSLGYDYMFKGGDFPKEIHRRVLWLKKLAADPRSLLVRTHDFIDSHIKTEDSDHLPNNITGVQLGGQYERQIKLGCETMLKEAEKLHACWYDVKCTFWQLRGPYRQPIANLFLEAMGYAPTPDGDIHPPHLKWLNDYVLKDKTKEDVVRRLGEFITDMDVAAWGTDLVAELQEIADTPHLNDNHLCEDGHDNLHKFIYFNVDVIPVVNLIVELSFSALHHAAKGNEGSAVLDMKMFAIMNLYHDGKEKQRALKSLQGNEYKFKKVLETKRHVISWAKSLLGMATAVIRNTRVLRKVPKVTTWWDTSTETNANAELYADRADATVQYRAEKGTSHPVFLTAMMATTKPLAHDAWVQAEGEVLPSTARAKEALTASFWDKKGLEKLPLLAWERLPPRLCISMRTKLRPRPLPKLKRPLTAARKRNYPLIPAGSPSINAMISWWLKRHLGVIRMILRYLGPQAPTEIEHYPMMTDRANFLESGIMMRGGPAPLMDEEDPPEEASAVSSLVWCLPAWIDPDVDVVPSALALLSSEPMQKRWKKKSKAPKRKREIPEHKPSGGEPAKKRKRKQKPSTPSAAPPVNAMIEYYWPDGEAKGWYECRYDGVDDEGIERLYDVQGSRVDMYDVALAEIKWRRTYLCAKCSEWTHGARKCVACDQAR